MKSSTKFYLKRFPYFWREYGFKNAWFMLTNRDIEEPVKGESKWH